MAQRRRRNNGVVDFMDGFNSTYGTAKQVLTDAELNQIAKAEAETSNGFSEGQGEQLRAAADSGQYDVSFNQETGNYDVTPKAGGEAGAVTPGKRTTFLGKTVDGEMSQGQIDNARLLAMSGVYSKMGNPEKALALKQQARQGELTDLQIKQANRADREGDREEKYKAGIADWQANSRWGQVQAANTKAEQDYSMAMADYDAKIKGGADPKAIGPAPSKPEKVRYGLGDSLVDTASFLSYESQHGKFDPSKWVGLAEKLDKVENEGYERALRAAESGAPLDKVAAEFNRSGQAKFDPKMVVSDKMGKTNIRGQQVDSRIITFKDADGNQRTINVASELAGIGGTKEILSTHFQIKEDQRSGARLGLAQQEFDANRSDKKEAKDKIKAKEEAAVGIYKQQHPGATESELAAVRNGVIPAIPEKNEIQTDFKPDGMGAGGTAVQKLKDGTIVATRISPDGKSSAPVVIQSPARPQQGAASVPPVDQRVVGKTTIDHPTKGRLIWSEEDGVKGWKQAPK